MLGQVTDPLSGMYKTHPIFKGSHACRQMHKSLAASITDYNSTVRLQVGAIIVSPTRELAKQIFGVAQPFLQMVAKATGMLLVGGR